MLFINSSFSLSSCVYAVRSRIRAPQQGQTHCPSKSPGPDLKSMKISQGLQTTNILSPLPLPIEIFLISSFEIGMDLLMRLL